LVSLLTRRLLIVEDERLVASMLAEVLERAHFQVEVAHSAVDAMALASSFDPDGALIDVHLGSGPSGLQLGHRLQVTRPEMRLIFLSRFGVPTSTRGGSEGLPPSASFVSKDAIDDPAELVALVEHALRRSAYREIRQPETANRLRNLTPTQVEVLRLAAQGMTNQAMADRLNTGVRSVEQRLARVYEALGIEVGGEVNPRVEAIRQYIGAYGLPSAALPESRDA
jgi:DNA-binding NarL/FixJ family response regulator